jgi:hypothetical protein
MACSRANVYLFVRQRKNFTQIILARKAALSTELGGKILFYPSLSGLYHTAVRLFEYRELKFIKMEWPDLTCC